MILNVRLSKFLVQEKDINIIWEGPIANHSLLIYMGAAKVDMILHLYSWVVLVVSVIWCNYE